MWHCRSSRASNHLRFRILDPLLACFSGTAPGSCAGWLRICAGGDLHPAIESQCRSISLSLLRPLCGHVYLFHHRTFFERRAGPSPTGHFHFKDYDLTTEVRSCMSYSHADVALLPHSVPQGWRVCFAFFTGRDLLGIPCLLTGATVSSQSFYTLIQANESYSNAKHCSVAFGAQPLA